MCQGGRRGRVSGAFSALKEALDLGWELGSFQCMPALGSLCRALGSCGSHLPLPKGLHIVPSSQPTLAGWQLAGSREIRCLQRLKLLTV